MSQLKVNSIVPVGGLPSGANGGIIQVVSATKTDTASFSSTSFQSISGLSVTITPSSNSNKILICSHINFGENDARYDVRDSGFERHRISKDNRQGRAWPSDTSVSTSTKEGSSLIPQRCRATSSPATLSPSRFSPFPDLASVSFLNLCKDSAMSSHLA